MLRNKIVLWGWLLCVAVVLRAGASDALLSDQKASKWLLIGKLKAQATFRTTDTPDNNPIPIEAGDLISQRNLLFLEFKHNLGDVVPGLQLAYFLQARFFYDGAWDYGPDVLSDDDTRRYYLYDNRDQIDDLKKDADLFIGYLDVTSGPFFCRIGRQVLSWGEMSTLRVLDGTNPLDNSTLSVDLLERLVPLAMIRTSLAFDYVGPFSSLSLQGYYVPGKLDNTNGEDIIGGSPIMPPIGRYTIEDLEDPFSLASLSQVADQVEDDIDSDRFGVKLGMMVGGLNLSFAYYRTYSDIPVPFLDVDALHPVYLWEVLGDFDPEDPLGSILGGQKLKVLLDIEEVDVYGGSFNYQWEWIDTVLRGEFALYKNVPKMTGGSIETLVKELGGKIYLLPGLSVGSLISGLDLGSLGNMVLPFSTGTIATFDVLKYGFGVDKWMKIPPLNTEDFIIIAEYVGSKILDYQDETILLPWQGPHGETLYETEYSHTFVLIANTSYLNGNLTPQLVAMYEVAPRAFSCIPSVKVVWRNMEFEASYFHTISDTYEGNLGMLESRNEVSFSVTYNF